MGRIVPNGDGEREELRQRRQAIVEQINADLDLVDSATAAQQRAIMKRMLRLLRKLVRVAT